MQCLYVDTSAWLAYANRSDPDHSKIRQALQSFQGRLVTSNFVFDETVTLSCLRLGHAVATRVGEVLLDPTLVDLIGVTPGDEAVAWSLFLHRSAQGYSYTDCTSLVVLKRLGLRRVAALGEVFRREGLEQVP